MGHRFLSIADPTNSFEWMIFLSKKYLSMFLEGTWLTLYIAVLGTLLGFVLGYVIGIIQTAYNKILEAHNKLPFNEECSKCKYLYLCKTGCPFVKNTYKTNKGSIHRLCRNLS